MRKAGQSCFLKVLVRGGGGDNDRLLAEGSGGPPGLLRHRSILLLRPDLPGVCLHEEQHCAMRCRLLYHRNKRGMRNGRKLSRDQCVIDTT